MTQKGRPGGTRILELGSSIGELLNMLQLFRPNKEPSISANVIPNALSSLMSVRPSEWQSNWSDQGRKMIDDEIQKELLMT